MPGCFVIQFVQQSFAASEKLLKNNNGWQLFTGFRNDGTLEENWEQNGAADQRNTYKQLVNVDNRSAEPLSTVFDCLFTSCLQAF